MSTRSTPVTSYTNGTFSHSLTSTNNTSFGASSSRRVRRADSLSLSSVTELSRRPSILSPRNIPKTAASDTSTPNSRRIKQQQQQQQRHVGEMDWAGMEPDEVFRRLPVNEVRKVESKMREDALNKQSELRSMVGTRYRDLLTSATQITTLHSSSLHLSSSLRTVAQACSNPSDIPSTSEGDSLDQSEEEDVMSMLPVAAHMKLLLDAPEALYSYLSHRAYYLSAAFLWLVTRVVKEGLTSMRGDVSAPYLPLLNKQWETLVPFRGQIVQRATAALRSRDKMDAKVLSETLLAIILLDNLPLPDALALLLSQRTKTVRDILANSPESSIPTLRLSPVINRRRSNSRASATPMSHEAIGAVLTEAIQCLLDTVTAATAVFDRRKRTLHGESLIEEMVRLIQVGDPASTPAPPQQSPMRTSHQRRTSRLASMSLPFPKVSLSAHGPPVSTRQILQSLPSSQILLRYLPSSITAFTPFITPSPPPPVPDKILAWRNSSTQLVRDSVPSWLAGLNSVTDIWHLRVSLESLLSDGDFEIDLRAALEAGWGARVKDVWSNKLEELVRSAEIRVREAGEQIRVNGEESDTNATSFMFSEINFPSSPTTTLNSSHNHSAALNTFIIALKKRSSYRTPLLDSVLTSLEDFATSLKADMPGLPKRLIDDFRERVGTSLEMLVQVLGKVLESMGPGRGGGKHGIEAELFVGRVALYLAKSSSFLRDVAGDAEVNTVSLIEALLRVHAASTARWQQRATREAISQLAPLFDPHLGPTEVQASWQGPYPIQLSSPIMISLQSLVVSVRQLGIPPGVKLPIVTDLVKGFVSDAREMPGWLMRKDEAAAQAAFDLAFLGMLEGMGAGKNMVVQKLLSKIPPSIPADFAENLPCLIADALRRTQLLLHPLLTHLDPSNLPTAATTAETRGGLLRFGAPSASKIGGIGSTEFRSPVAVARPGKRFPLLSIAA